MVKNTTGGSKAKGQARKSVSQAPSQKIRLAVDVDEFYAKVTAAFGNGMCEVICIDGRKRLCHIRGIFRGRGKRDNFINRNTYLLVGRRSFESDEEKIVKGKVKLPNCDLLEVYSDQEMDRIKSLDSKDYDWSIFIEEKAIVPSHADAAEIVFNDNVADDDYAKIMADFKGEDSAVINITNEIIDIDDI
jgi:translation initiation factor 1A